MALEQPFPERLQFVLGTESGMITSIVRKVQGMLRGAGRTDVAVEIVFPVSAEAITTDKQAGAAQVGRGGGRTAAVAGAHRRRRCRGCVAIAMQAATM